MFVIRSEDLKLKISIKTFLLQINFQPMNKKKNGEIRMCKLWLSVCLSEKVMFGMGFVCLSI